MPLLGSWNPGVRVLCSKELKELISVNYLSSQLLEKKTNDTKLSVVCVTFQIMTASRL